VDIARGSEERLTATRPGVGRSVAPPLFRADPSTARTNGALSLEGSFWRNVARWGSARGPEWFVRVSPPVVGLVACGIAADRRRHVLQNLRRVRGRAGAVRDALDVARTFVTYASCLAEILGASSPRRRLPEAVVWGEPHVQDALADGRGVVLVTAHTAGWEAIGSLLCRDHALRVMIVEQAEPNPVARAIQDEARQAHGLLVAHVGGDPLSALSLASHLRGGGVVALQIDRAPRWLRARRVTMFGGAALVPEGPLRLAMLTGAPLVPVFASRTGHRRYDIVAYPPVRVRRSATTGELDATAQNLADALESFVRLRPTQWFHFRDD
jgi:lauroyl/myristoyl acyltransferase